MPSITGKPATYELDQHNGKSRCEQKVDGFAPGGTGSYSDQPKSGECHSNQRHDGRLVSILALKE